MTTLKTKKEEIKVSDYIIKFTEDLGVKHIFLVSGGGSIHLVDSVGKSKKLIYICNHHEQASSIAAEAYSRITGNIGTCLVTTGPGSTNALTGLIGAWLDSIPVLFISGQIKRETIANYKKMRQIGDQEINIIGMVKAVTKYAVTVMKPEDIRYHLQKAVFYAKLSGLPTIADDGGIEIDGLSGEPGVRSRRYFGKDGKEATDEEIMEAMRELIKKLPPNKLGAAFKVVITLALATGKTFSVSGEVSGILKDPHLKLLHGYPYRSFFFLPKLNKYYHENELSQEEQKQYNHRYKAIEKLKPIIKNEID